MIDSKFIIVGILVIIIGLLSVLIYNTKEVGKLIDRWLTLLQPYMLLVFMVSLVVSVIYFSIHYSSDFLPSPVSNHGKEIVPLFLTTTIITGFTFFLTQLLLFFFAFKYRTQKDRKAKFLKNFIKLELFWTVVPALTFLFLFIWGQILWSKINSEPEGDVLDIEVMGEQFIWRMRYPGKDQQFGQFNFRLIDKVNDMGLDLHDPRNLDDFMPIQMHVPKNRPVRLSLRARDVIHSFFIPHFRIKMDAVPGMITKISFIPTATTKEMRANLKDPDFNYEVACAELCGRMHYAMKLILVVDEPEEFDRWYKEQKSWTSEYPEYASEIK